MNKINRVFSTVTISLIILFAIGIAGTYLSDYLVSISWFGDYTSTYIDYNNNERPINIYGARHYWYNWGVFLLFTTSSIRAIAKVFSIIDEK
tara:strand:- start:299 stop:574 length:276 start_codon:yes stop_codon:yes gene_type:complete